MEISNKMEKRLDSSKRRVKVYQLDRESQWEDKGTGHVACHYVEKYQGLCLVVRSEKDGETILLESKIVPEEIYQLQQETLIVWNDPSTEADLALSFQEAPGCKEIWEQLCAVQKLSNMDLRNEEDNAHIHTSVEEESDVGVFSDQLPPPNLANLDKILQIILMASTAFKRERLAMSMVKENYIRKLLDLFSVCEDLEDDENLRTMFQIFKGLILLNETSLFELMFSDDLMLPIMGALEYDPEFPKRARHREYLKSQAIFKEVIPFENPDLVAKIHQTFRIQYLKDVALPRSLDDPTFATLNSLIFFNNVEIVSQIQNDERFLKRLFRDICDPNTESSKLKDLILFLQELCNLAKNLQLQSRIAFYHTLNRHEFLPVLAIAMSHDDVKIRLATVNILDCVVNHDPSMLRQFSLSQRPKCELFTKLIDCFLEDPEMGIRVQLTEILRVLIDTTTLEEEPQKDEFLSLFYSDHILRLIEPLSEKPEKEVNESVKESIVEILGFCVTHHGYRIKYFLLGNNITGKVLTLLKSRHKHVVLAAIRFFRAFVGMKDDFYNKHLIMKNLFDPIIEVFKLNGNRYNLLNSAIIELFEFIRKENIKPLIQCVAERYGEYFKTVEYVETFKSLLKRYEQMQENPADSASSTPTPSSQNGSRAEEEDDDYFNTEDDEESPPVASSTVSEKDEEFEKFKPLTHKQKEEAPAIKLKSDKAENGLQKKKISINLHGFLKEEQQPQTSEEGSTPAKRQKT